MTVLTSIVFLKTNAYDSNGVCITMSLVQRWLEILENSGIGFPSNFDFTFFMKGIFLTFELEHSVSTPRTIHLLYKTLHYFPIDLKCSMILTLFKSNFYDLFFNWSYNIRDLFMALILYQIEYFFI